jgi:two-component system, LytTR family, response regulator
MLKSRIRTLIVDDEPPARDLVATLLRDEQDAEVVAECSNGREAVGAIQQFAPDLVFLDVRMPVLDGFGVLGQLQGHLPLVIFITAYDQHAMRAFEAHALDYLLKPFDFERFRQAFDRARRQLNLRDNSLHQERLLALIEDLRGQANGWDRIALREQGKVTFIKPPEIDWIESEGNYVRLHIGHRSCLLRETMSSMEARLAEKKFVRVSRSALVNLEKIKEWHPLFHGDSVLVLDDGLRVPVSRVFRERLDELVAGLD